MSLKSMKITKADRDARKKGYGVCSPMGGDDYPYGLRVTLDEDALKKLGLTKLPKAGAYVALRAECCVISVSVNERDGKTDRRIELQMEKLEVIVPPGTAEDAIGDAIDAADDDEDR